MALDIDYLLCQYGYISNLGPIKDWGFGDGPIAVNNAMQ